MRDNSKDPQDAAVICDEGCGLQFLTSEQELAGLSNPDSPWRCPKCGGSAEWDDECRSTNPPEPPFAIIANWRPHTEKPTEIPVTAVIAARDPDDGEIFLLSGVHTFTKHRDQWWDEITAKPVDYAEFWWLPEEELIAPLPKAVPA